MNKENIATAMSRVSAVMTEKREYLVKLDQFCGDGDLGVSMASGFAAVKACLDEAEETDLGKLFRKMANAFNEAAPSSLGTIISIGMMGMAVSLKGKDTMTLGELAGAMNTGVERIMQRAKSKPGEKTVLDGLVPAVEALLRADRTGAEWKDALSAAAKAAADGAESTRNMIPQHGRAAYYGDKNLGHLDGGAEVARLMFQALAE